MPTCRHYVADTTQTMPATLHRVGYSHAHSTVYEARRFDELSAGSLLCPDIDAEIELLLVKKYDTR
jgi:hypothetical protein